MHTELLFPAFVMAVILIGAAAMYGGWRRGTIAQKKLQDRQREARARYAAQVSAINGIEAPRVVRDKVQFGRR